MIEISLSILTKAIYLVDSLGKIQVAIELKEELFKIKMLASKDRNSDNVKITEKLAKNLCTILNNNNLQLDDLVPNNFILGISCPVDSKNSNS